MRPFVFLPLMLCLASPAMAADESCLYAADIVALSRTILEQRPELGRFQVKQHGAEAAYLLIRYGQLSDDEERAIIEPLIADKVWRAEDLAVAWAVARLGADHAFDLLDQAQADPVYENWSALRALILGGQGSDVVARIAERDAEAQLRLSRAVIVAVHDQPDAVKQDLIGLAKASGLTELAAGLAATESDPEAWTDMMAEIADPAERADLYRLWHYDSVFAGLPELPRPDTLPPREVDLFTTIAAAAAQPQRDYLSTFFNQTGDAEISNAAGAVLLAAIDNGTLNPKGSFADGWVLTYEALVEASGARERIDRDLTAISTGTERKPRVSVRDELDWILAAKALGSYVAGDGATAPDVPADGSAQLADAWSSWTELAATLRAGNAGSLPDDGAVIAQAAELLYAAGRYEDLADLLSGATPTSVTVSSAEDFVKRLDRMCGAYLWHLGEAAVLIGEPIFKFD